MTHTNFIEAAQFACALGLTQSAFRKAVHEDYVIAQPEVFCAGEEYWTREYVEGVVALIEDHRLKVFRAAQSRFLQNCVPANASPSAHPTRRSAGVVRIKHSDGKVWPSK